MAKERERKKGRQWKREEKEEKMGETLPSRYTFLATAVIVSLEAELKVWLSTVVSNYRL